MSRVCALLLDAYATRTRPKGEGREAREKPETLEQVSSFYECSALVSCIEIAELFLAGSSDRVCYSAKARRKVLMTRVEMA